MDHSPESYLGHHTSMVRNTLSLTSLGIAIVGFGTFFSDRNRDMSEYVVRGVGLLVFVYAILYGIKGTMNYCGYLEYLESNYDDLPRFYKSQLKQWKEWVYYQYGFIALVVIITIVVSLYKLNTKFSK